MLATQNLGTFFGIPEDMMAGDDGGLLTVLAVFGNLIERSFKIHCLLISVQFFESSQPIWSNLIDSFGTVVEGEALMFEGGVVLQLVQEVRLAGSRDTVDTNND